MRLFVAVPAHYGSDYIGYAIRAVYHRAVEVCVVVQPPWRNAWTCLSNPETPQDLDRAARQLGDPESKITIHWEKWFGGEQAQWAYFEERARGLGCDYVLRLPPDEIWPSDVLDWYLDYAEWHKANVAVPRTHLWRSFIWACEHDARAERIVCVFGDGKPTMQAPELWQRVFDFGYARRCVHVLYRNMLRWYREDWRGGWFEKVFLPNGKRNLHPFIDGAWNARPFDKGKLPAFMESHPYWNEDPIW